MRGVALGGPCGHAGLGVTQHHRRDHVALRRLPPPLPEHPVQLPSAPEAVVGNPGTQKPLQGVPGITAMLCFSRRQYRPPLLPSVATSMGFPGAESISALRA